MDGSIARRWRELSGERNWEDLLEPLDPDLRRYIIHYGQMAGAVGDLFDSRTKKPGATEEEFFSKACLVKGNPYEYEVSRFIYAGSQSVKCAWIGYVAVATDRGKRALGRRDILIAWRGTATTSEWINNFQVSKRATASESDLFPGQTNAKIHRGFHSLYTGTRPDNRTSAREQVRVAVEQLVNRYEAEDISITVTGFSLGAALATLTAMDIVTHGYNKPPNGEPFMVTAFTFGGPRVGDRGLARVFDTLGLENLRLLRIKNIKDPITEKPPKVLRYTNVGKELVVDTSRSIYLNQRPLACNSISVREDGYQTLWWVYYGLWVFMYLNELWLPLIGLMLILIWDKINRGIMGGDKYQTLCWVCYEASMYMVYKRLWFPLSVLIVILDWAEKNRMDGYEYQTWRRVCYGLSLFMVHKSYWIPLLGSIIYFIWGESNIRRYRYGGDEYQDIGEDQYGDGDGGEYQDGDGDEYQDIGEDQDVCDLITVSEDEDEDEDEDGDGDRVVVRVLHHISKKSMFKDVCSCHNMDVYLHGVAIKDIDENTPVEQLDHDIALVNKHSDRVKAEHRIVPSYWWVGKNRNRMLQGDDGRWITRDV
ncbi:hypothetical protein V6N13_004088 [Hibiscus sabdariffa]